jgi:hypothetical protein
MITIYCPKCGQHWKVQMAMGGWLQTCLKCNEQCRVCWNDETCNQAKRHGIIDQVHE